MTTPNFNLPLITGNMTADVPRDMNALAEATDGAITQAFSNVETQLIEHLSESVRWMQFNRGDNQSVPQNIQHHLTCNEYISKNNADFSYLGEDGFIYIKEKGLYLVFVYAVFDINSIGYRYLFTEHVADLKNAVGTVSTPVATTSLVEYEVGAKVDFTVLQNSGAALNVTNLVVRLLKLGAKE